MRKKDLKKIEAMDLNRKAMNALICAVWKLVSRTDFEPEGDKEFLEMIGAYVDWTVEFGDCPTKKSVKRLAERLNGLSIEGIKVTMLARQAEDLSEEEKKEPLKSEEIKKMILG